MVDAQMGDVNSTCMTSRNDWRGRASRALQSDDPSVANSSVMSTSRIEVIRLHRKRISSNDDFSMEPTKNKDATDF